MLYAVYPSTNQKNLIFDYSNSENYAAFDEESKINADDFKLTYSLKKEPKNFNSLDFIFSNGPILISEKVQNVLATEIENGVVQIFDVTIDGHNGANNFKALHVIHIESSINLEESIFEVDDDEFEFELEVLKEDFEWDLSIAKSKEVPFQLVINDDLKNRLIESKVKNINLYTQIDDLNENNSVCIQL